MEFSDYFDKVFCINVVTNKERRESITKQMSILGISKYEFYNAIPLNKIRSIKDREQFLRNSIAWTTGSYGCTLSHYSIIKQCYELGYKSVFVFEDDVVWIKDKNKIKEYMDNLPNDWDYVWFTPSFFSQQTNEKKIRDLLYIHNSEEMYINMKNIETARNDFSFDNVITKHENLWNSGCYAMNRKAMNIFIDTIENGNLMTSSDRIKYLNYSVGESPLNIYTTNIRLVGQSMEIDALNIDKNGNVFIGSDGCPHAVMNKEDFIFDSVFETMIR